MMRTFVIAALVAAASFVSPAQAQTEIGKKAIAKASAAAEKVVTACAADLQKFCGAVTPGNGRGLLCLIAHEDKISDRCFTTLVDVGDAIDDSVSAISRAANVCAGDIRKHCASVPQGQGRIAQCLVNKKSQLKPACRNEVVAIEARVSQ